MGRLLCAIEPADYSISPNDQGRKKGMEAPVAHRHPFWHAAAPSMTLRRSCFTAPVSS